MECDPGMSREVRGLSYRPRFGLNWYQFDDAERIYQSVGKSAFTAALAAEIIGKSVHQFSPTIGAFKNNKVIHFDHDSPRMGYYGKAIPWYKFTEQWCYWYETKYQQLLKKEGLDGIKVHAE